jgi:hypothetical protein
MASKRQAVFVVLLVFAVGVIAMHFLQKTEAFQQPPSTLTRLQQYANAPGLTGEQQQIATLLNPLLAKQASCETQGLSSSEMSQILAYFEQSNSASGLQKLSHEEVKQQLGRLQNGTMRPTVGDMKNVIYTGYEMGKTISQKMRTKTPPVDPSRISFMEERNETEFRNSMKQWEGRGSNEVLTPAESAMYKNGIVRLDVEYEGLRLL